LPPNEDTFF
jgi:hypothetical protein